MPETMPIDDLLERAGEHHRAGRHTEAEAIYQDVLSSDDQNADAWHFCGLRLCESGEYDRSIPYLLRAVALRDDDGRMQVNLGQALHRVGQLLDAESRYVRAIELAPGLVEAHYNLGVAYKDQNRLADAARCYRRAIELNPACADSQNNLGMVLKDLKEYGAAMDCLRRAIELRPDFAEAFNNLGLVHTAERRYDEAVEFFRRTLSMHSEYAEGHNNLGIALAAQGRAHDAIACFRRATELKPDYAAAHNNLGNALNEAGVHHDAESCYRRAIELEPHLAEPHNNLGVAATEHDRWDEARACYERSIELQPDCAEPYNNLGVALADQRRLDESNSYYERALQLEPDHAEAHWNRALNWLAIGDFQRGWPEYEWRWQRSANPPRDFPQPRWNGESLIGKTILLHAEQGLGDTIQFIRFAAFVKQRGGRVVVECQRPLIRLLSGCAGIDQLVAQGDELPPFEIHLPLMSLPFVFNTTRDAIPAEVPYVFADAVEFAHWTRELEAFDGLRVGIVWRGNPAHKKDRARSIPLAHLEPLRRVGGTHFISIQKDAREDEARALARRFQAIDVGAKLTDFAATAGLIANLDLVITCDSAPAHLAGALGVPVWVALRYAPDWRWMLDRNDSPWYPSMRLFRQEAPGDWIGVFERMADELTRFAVQRRSAERRRAVTQLAGIGTDRLSTAMALHQAGRLAEAELAYRELISAEPANADAWHLLGLVAAQLNQTDTAIELVGKAITLNENAELFHNDLGQLLHSRGQLADAAQCFRRALKLCPKHVDARFNLALTCEALGEIDAAVAGYRHVLDLRPDYVKAHHNLGIVLTKLGHFDLAQASLSAALELDPDFAPAHFNRGIMLGCQREFEAAAHAYRRAIVIAPDFVEAHLHLAATLREMGQYADAVAALRTALQLKPGCIDALICLGRTLQGQNDLAGAVECFRRAMDIDATRVDVRMALGAVLQQLGAYDDAFRCYAEILDLDPQYHDAHLCMGNAQREAGNLRNAARCYVRAIRLVPNSAESFNNLGVVLKQLGKHAWAAACYSWSLTLNPRNAQAHFNRGVLWEELRRFDDAIACYRMALQIAPTYADAQNNLGVSLHKQGRFDEANDCYRATLAIEPQHTQALNNVGIVLKDRGHLDQAANYFSQLIGAHPEQADSHWNLALISLLKGDFDAGWQGYEWRWKRTGADPLRFREPPWDGGPLAGKTIFLHAEQGLGDTIQFVRYARILKERGARVSLGCPPPLQRLLASCPDVDVLVGHGEPIPQHDVHCPLLSLPRAFYTRLSTIPASCPYLVADPEIRDRWHDIIGDYPGVTVGIAWQGSTTHTNDFARSIALQQFESLARIPGVRLVSLQKGVGVEQLTEAAGRVTIADLGSRLHDFADTAGLMMNLDLVITCDSAPAHLAGALGVPVWVAIPFAPDWRWLLDREDSPWYPTMRLFRQKSPGDWPSVFERIEQELRSLAAIPAARRRLADGSTTAFALQEGIRNHQAGDLNLAREFYQQILELNPRHAEALHLLGVLEGQTGRDDQAGVLISKAVEIDGGDSAYHYNLGRAHAVAGRQEQAIASYRRAVELRPDFIAALLGLGVLYREQNLLGQATSWFERILAISPEHPDALAHAGELYFQLREWAKAAHCFRRLVAQRPGDATCHVWLGKALRAAGHVDEAIDHLRRATELNPDSADAGNELGAALLATGATHDALECFATTLRLIHTAARSESAMSPAMPEAADWDAPLQYFRRVSALARDCAGVYGNQAIALQDLRRFDEARQSFARALELDPQSVQTRSNHGQFRLLMGEFEPGWSDYESRLDSSMPHARSFGQPAWIGEPLLGKTILLHAEQGAGDTIQFARFIKLVAVRGARVHFECQRSLLGLFNQFAGVDRLLGQGDELPSFDVHCPLVSLPGVFGTNLQNLPAEVPYLFAPDALIRRWQSRLSTHDILKVGIAWRGNPDHKRDRYRSIPFEHFRQLAEITNVRLLSIQKGPAAETPVELTGVDSIVDLGSQLHDFADTAGLMMNLDLVITCDSAPAHLAGALGVPVWVAIPFAPDWRWLLDREDSPWYPTMRLFRQSSPGDWEGVFQRIEDALRQLVAERGLSTAANSARA